MQRTYVKYMLMAVVALCCASGCAQAAPSGKFRLAILRGDKTLLSCRFAGEDKNDDGMLEAGELSAFTEIEDYAVSETSRSTGFAAYADMAKMPMLEHGLADLRAFRFNLNEFKKGQTALEYKTDTKRDFTFGKYHFWRIVEIKTGGKIGFFHGVGDGTRGLSLSMLDAAGLSFRVTAE
jgi:hypothetical protein